VELVNSYMDELVTSITELHTDIKDRQRKRYNTKLANQIQKHKTLPRLQIGDYVMVATTKTHQHKLAPIWAGPYEITDTKSEFVYEVRLLGDQKKLHAHVNRIKRLSGPELRKKAELISSELHSAQRFEVDYITAWKMHDSDIQLQVHWSGWQECDRTWERATSLYEDVPDTVVNYLQAVKHEHVKLQELLHSL